MEVIGTTEETGTIITFRPDADIFTDVVYKFDILASRLRDLGYLNAGIYLSLTDKREVSLKRRVPLKKNFSR